MNDQNYQAVLDFYRSSIRDERLLDVASPLPPLISLKLKKAAELIDQQPPAGDVGQGEALRLAVTQFAEKILFSDHGNYYRILGLNRDADTAQLKDHYKWLTRLLFPVEDMAHWNEADGELLNHAYGVLRDPKYRKAYDEELLNRGGVERTLDVKRDEAVAQAGSGRGGAAKAVASVLEREQYPEEEDITPEQAPAHPGRETEKASVGEADIHHVNPKPSAKTGTSRFPEDLMTAAGSTGPASAPIPAIDSSEFPSPELTDHEIHRSWGSLAMMIGFPIVVGLAVLVYLGYISLPFMDDQVKGPPLSVSINPPETAETGQVIVRSDQPLQDLAAGDGAGQDIAVQPLNDAVSDLRTDTHEAVTTAAGDTTPGLEAVPDKQAAAPSPDVFPKQDVVAAATQAPDREIKPVPPAAVPLSSGTAKREAVAAPPKDTAKTVRAEPRPKPAAPPPVKSTAKPPSSPATGSPSHRETGSVASAPAPAKEIKPAPPPAASRSSVVAKREAVVTPSQDTAKTTHAEQAPRPAAPPPSPVKSASEQPSAPSADLSVKPPPGDDKLTTAAARSQSSDSPGESSSTDQSSPSSLLQAVTVQHLGSMIKTFVSSYEAGDLDIFMSLFSDDVHTKSQKDRESIRIAYNQFFQATRNRRLKLSGLEWTQADKETLVGRAPFVLTLNQEGKKNLLQYSGTLIFHVEDRSPHLLITQFDYEYKGNK